MSSAQNTRKEFQMHLRAVGNPDHGQFASPAPDLIIFADSPGDLIRQVRDWQGDYDLGGGNWASPRVIRRGVDIGYMSYNGKIWPGNPEDWKVGSVPLFDPSVFPKPVPVTAQSLKVAPLTNEQLAQLRADANDIRATAIRKQVTLDEFDFRREDAAARNSFELGCWLYFYSRRVGLSGQEGFASRVDCARRIFESGIENPHYDFFTVFDFGERDFDTIFEMGDSKEVVAALVKLASKDPSGNLAQMVTKMGWSHAPSNIQSAPKMKG